MANRFYLITLIFLVLLLGYLSYQVLKPFLFLVAWAIVLSALFYPLYAFLLRYVKWRSIASLIVLIVIFTIIIGPLSYLVFLLMIELKEILDYVETEKIDAIKGITQHPIIRSLIERIIPLLNITEDELNKTIMDNITKIGKELFARITRGIGGIITGVVEFIFMLLSIFFLLRDGPEFLKKVRDYIPFSDEQKDRLVKQIKDIVVSTIYGGVVVAIVQGTMGGVAFAILGISSPVMWGLAMAIASFLPLIGPFIIWAPAAVFLVIQGEVLKGLVLAVIGVFGISMIDNFLRPLIIGGRTKMPFLVLFFGVLGGIKLFGLIGFIMGPMVLALFVSVIEMFRIMEEGGNK